jgi:uncharacterized membrane protein
MSFCPNCGTSVDGRFCAKCGTAVDAAGPGAVPPPPPPGVAPAAGGLTDNVAAALCYVLGLITGVLFLVLSPYNQNREIRFHAFQSIFMSVGLFAIHIVLMILGGMMHFLSLLLIPVSLLVSLGGFVLWIFLIISSFQGKKIVLPVIGPMAQQQA